MNDFQKMRLRNMADQISGFVSIIEEMRAQHLHEYNKQTAAFKKSMAGDVMVAFMGELEFSCNALDTAINHIETAAE